MMNEKDYEGYRTNEVHDVSEIRVHLIATSR